ncbi:related to methyltransferase involved in pre-rRNA cleavage [Phialocephala subalpina]|uniref:Ribosomal RNA-processing protein 8 n=1 Tax=Phialocephala subalpina TaxID=576137 RepID=A0A1L7XBT8_9HELO|nr:related to methyltransferase involved in pre-rRNA cleavage [Phialocephala subalpina]
MFAVPGWSVNSSLLKTQTAEAAPKKAKKEGNREERVHDESKPSKKRKRNKPQPPAKAPTPPKEASTLTPLQAENKSKFGPTSAPTAEDKPQPPAKAPTPPKEASTLTPLQAGMRAKLISARFRHLNQQLYTTPSADSLSLFQSNPEMFTEYHEGFRKQVEVWPENPVDGYISDIITRGKIRGHEHKHQKQKKSQEIPTDDSQSTNLVPLPRTEGTSTIADLGCGDAALSSALQPHTKKLHLKIHSFDLQSPSPLVTRADIANLPLPSGSVDIAIFCLALMGTNWVDFIEEAFRILRWKGELWISEIKSRFGRVAGAGKNKVVSHSVGNRKKQPLGKEGLKFQKRREEETNDAVAVVEVDGVEDRGGETDVSAFVEVLRKRGFVLRGEGKEGDNGSKAVNLRNKMFVKMWFVKGATPIKGKGVPMPKGGEEFGQGGSGETWKKKPKGKFIDEEEKHVSSEAGVLKPCVYKLR